MTPIRLAPVVIYFKNPIFVRFGLKQKSINTYLTWPSFIRISDAPKESLKMTGPLRFRLNSFGTSVLRRPPGLVRGLPSLTFSRRRGGVGRVPVADLQTKSTCPLLEDLVQSVPSERTFHVGPNGLPDWVSKRTIVSFF